MRCWVVCLLLVLLMLEGDAMKHSRRKVLDDPDLAKLGAGLLIVSEGEALLLLRGFHSNNPRTWGLPGGNADEDDDDLLKTAMREAQEEVGELPDNVRVIGKILTRRGKLLNKHFTVFVIEMPAKVKVDFEPVLNFEHTDYRWFRIDELDKIGNVHPIVKKLLKDNRKEFFTMLGAKDFIVGEQSG